MNINPLKILVRDKNGDLKLIDHPYIEVWTDSFGTIDCCENIEKQKKSNKVDYNFQFVEE